MNKLILLIVATLLVSRGQSQEAKKDAKVVQTKMEAFASRTGMIIKLVDTRLPDLKLYLGGVAETRIRKIISGKESTYFYQIESESKYSSNSASIEYADLLEIIKALKTLKDGVEKDIAVDPHYLENKFSTVDGFQIGCYVSKGKAQWFMKLEKYGSDDTLFIKDGDDLEIAFTNAKDKIEELSK